MDQLKIPFNITNQIEHPTRQNYLVFHFKDEDKANAFQLALEEAKLFYERAEQEEYEGIRYLFGVRKSDVDDVVQHVLSKTQGRGADLVFEAVGVPATVTLGTNLLRKGGTLTLIGNVTPQTDLLLQAVVTRELRLQGTCGSAGEYDACLAAMTRGAIDVSPFISVVAPLSEGADWFARLYQREAGLLKVVLQP